VNDAALALVRVTEECLDLAIEECRPGKHLGDIGAAVQDHAESRGYSVVREYVGHGIGRRMHEDPQIPNYGKRGQGPKIRAGYVFAVEPMINLGTNHTKVLADGWTVVTLDGKPSAHAEHTIAITEEGPEVLTRIAARAAAPALD
jgi:methionyl aminopeptidase